MTVVAGGLMLSDTFAFEKHALVMTININSIKYRNIRFIEKSPLTKDKLFYEKIQAGNKD